MKLYFAGIKTCAYLLGEIAKIDVLVSFVENWFPKRQYVGSVFLDSGAFTAWSTGKTIDIGDYVDYIHANAGRFDVVAGLDVIGDWEASKRNYLDMQADGIDFVPTFHVGDPWTFYDWMLSNFDYVALGGLVPYISATKSAVYKSPVIRFMIMAHRLAQMAKVGLHGFGMTSWNMVRMFPWASVDSTTYLAGQKYARPLYLDRNNIRGQTNTYRRAVAMSRRLGMNFSADDLCPGRKGATSEERYRNILLHNIEVMRYAVKLLNRNSKGV